MSQMGALVAKKRTHILNDDILTRILSELSIRQLFCVQRVCRQFRDCSVEALKLKTSLRIGDEFKDLVCDHSDHSISGANVSKAVAVKNLKYDLLRDIVADIDAFVAVLKSCPNVKAVYLSECRLNAQVIETLIRHCNRLECLTLVANYWLPDPKEWQTIVNLLASFKLRHLAVVGQCYEMAFDQSEPYVRSFAQQIEYMMPFLTSLEKLVLRWYSEPLFALFNSLPKSLRALHLIHCSKMTISSVWLLRPENLPNLRELKVDTKFFDRDKETPMFQTICKQLSLDSLVFYCDTPLEISAYCALMRSQIKNLSLKFRENRNPYHEYVPMPYLSTQHLRTLTIDNLVFEPQFVKRMAKSFPLLESLTILDVTVKCNCDYWNVTDGESLLIWGYIQSDCGDCKAKSLGYLTRMKALRRLTIAQLFFYERIECLKDIENLSVLKLLDIWPQWMSMSYVDVLGSTCLDICRRRRTSGSSEPFTVVCDTRFGPVLEKAISKITSGSLPNNLRLKKSF